MQSTSRRALVALSKYSREKRAESTYRTLFRLPFVSSRSDSLFKKLRHVWVRLVSVPLEKKSVRQYPNWYQFYCFIVMYNSVYLRNIRHCFDLLFNLSRQFWILATHSRNVFYHFPTTAVFRFSDERCRNVKPQSANKLDADRVRIYPLFFTSYIKMSFYSI